MTNSIVLTQKKANESLTDLPEGAALLAESMHVHATCNDDGMLVRQLTPASILSSSEKSKGRAASAELGDALSEVGKLRNDIAGMEAVLQAVKGVFPESSCSFEQRCNFGLSLTHLADEQLEIVLDAHCLLALRPAKEQALCAGRTHVCIRHACMARRSHTAPWVQAATRRRQ